MEQNSRWQLNIKRRWFFGKSFMYSNWDGSLLLGFLGDSTLKQMIGVCRIDDIYTTTAWIHAKRHFQFSHVIFLHTHSQIENQEAKNVMTSETSENFHRENPYHFLIQQFHLGIYFDFPFNIYLLLSAYFRHSYNIPSSSKMSIVTK